MIIIHTKISNQRSLTTYSDTYFCVKYACHEAVISQNDDICQYLTKSLNICYYSMTLFTSSTSCGIPNYGNITFQKVVSRNYSFRYSNCQSSLLHHIHFVLHKRFFLNYLAQAIRLKCILEIINALVTRSIRHR